MLTQNQLDEFDETFWYHAGVLVSQSKLYLLGGERLSGTPEYAAADALFEMLLVRLRTFDSFFSATNIQQQDDAIATQFAANWNAHHFLTADERQNINKRLPHLTYSQPPVHEWPIGQMVHRCLGTILDFLQHVPGNLTPRWAYRRQEITDYLAGEFTQHALDDIWTEQNRHAHRR